MSRQIEWGEVSEDGALQLPENILSEMGFSTGAKFKISFDGQSLTLSRALNQLQKIYIEPTTRCNLNCTMCIRNSWDEQPGDMSQSTFSAILSGLDDFHPTPLVSFSGLGEPLMHPKIIEWIRLVKEKGAQVELITNGTLLTRKMSLDLINTGLDILWVSIDSASPESYADVRLGARLSEIINNLKAVPQYAAWRPSSPPQNRDCLRCNEIKYYRITQGDAIGQISRSQIIFCQQYFAVYPGYGFGNVVYECTEEYHLPDFRLVAASQPA